MEKKKQLTELTEEELKNVTGGSTPHSFVFHVGTENVPEVDPVVACLGSSCNLPECAGSSQCPQNKTIDPDIDGLQAQLFFRKSAK